MKNRLFIICTIFASILICTIITNISVDAYSESRLEVENDDIIASSTLAGGDYSTNNLNDGDLTTAWVEGVTGVGEGEYIDFMISKGQRIDDIAIATGYQKSENLFLKNAAPTKVTILSGTYKETVTVKDEMGVQIIPLAPIISNGEVRVRIDSVRYGSAYEDTCISSLHFLKEADFKAKYRNTTISFGTIGGAYNRYGIITSRDKYGDILWSKTLTAAMTELDTLQIIGLNDGNLLYIEEGAIHAVSAFNGKEKWCNDEFHGASANYAFTSDDDLILCGYYGPDFFMCDKEGNTLARIESFDDRYYWPFDIQLTRDELFAEVTLEGGKTYPESTKFFVNLDDFSYKMAK